MYCTTQICFLLQRSGFANFHNAQFGLYSTRLHFAIQFFGRAGQYRERAVVRELFGRIGLPIIEQNVSQIIPKTSAASTSAYGDFDAISDHPVPDDEAAVLALVEQAAQSVRISRTD